MIAVALVLSASPAPAVEPSELEPAARRADTLIGLCRAVGPSCGATREELGQALLVRAVAAAAVQGAIASADAADAALLVPESWSAWSDVLPRVTAEQAEPWVRAWLLPAPAPAPEDQEAPAPSLPPSRAPQGERVWLDLGAGSWSGGQTKTLQLGGVAKARGLRWGGELDVTWNRQPWLIGDVIMTLPAGSHTQALVGPRVALLSHGASSLELAASVGVGQLPRFVDIGDGTRALTTKRRLALAEVALDATVAIGRGAALQLTAASRYGSDLSRREYRPFDGTSSYTPYGDVLHRRAEGGVRQSWKRSPWSAALLAELNAQRVPSYDGATRAGWEPTLGGALRLEYVLVGSSGAFDTATQPTTARGKVLTLTRKRGVWSVPCPNHRPSPHRRPLASTPGRGSFAACSPSRAGLAPRSRTPKSSCRRRCSPSCTTRAGTTRAAARCCRSCAPRCATASWTAAAATLCAGGPSRCCAWWRTRRCPSTSSARRRRPPVVARWWSC